MSTPTVQEQLAHNLNSLQRKMHGPLLKDVGDEFLQQRRKRAKLVRAQEKTARRQFGRKAATTRDRRGPRQSLRRELFDFLVLSVGQLLERLQALQRRYEEFRRHFAGAPSERERRRLILDYARDLGARPGQLRGDARALHRWFGDDAMNDRYAKRKGAAEQKLVFCLDRLGTCAATNLEAIRDSDSATAAWDRLALEKLFRAVTQYRGDARVEAAGLHCLRKAVSALPDGVAETVIGNWTRSFVERIAVDENRDVSVQCESLVLLHEIAPRQLDKVLEVRLRQPGNGDDLFVHRCCVRLLGARVKQRPELVELITIAAENPSSFVRQQLAETVTELPADAAVYWLHHLAVEDRDPKVRAAALLTALTDHRDNMLVRPYLELIAKVLANETDPFVLRTALLVSTEYLRRGLRCEIDCRESGQPTVETQEPPIATAYRVELLPAIRRLQVTAASLPVRRWAAQAAEQIWVELDPDASCLLRLLRERLAGLRSGASRWISKRALGGGDEILVGRVLAVMAQEDYGFDVQRGWRGYCVTRGPVFRRRAWRVLHELFTPATDKRQAFRHTIGRVSEATIRAPSQVLAELSETKVPGEPLWMSDEGGWRPYLPLPDDFLSAIRVGFGRPRPAQFFTSEGVTTVVPPAGLVSNLLAYCRLTWNFARYARLRNWREGNSTSPRSYLERFTQLGFQIHFRAYEDEERHDDGGDTSVTRFFPLLCPLIFGLALPLRQYLVDFADYFGSLFQNSVLQLLVFITASMSVFLANHLYANWSLRRSREALGLSIGGWGTRGKSGTERLKAALLNALGCGVVSKSSGCEAMFMVGAPFGELRELLLYRPADKATIWEHRDVLRLATRLKATVFLWECMGLTPAYVEVLQQQWSCDDLSTITNAYPDHEDLQGPAGWNVAEVISGFVPRRARLLTSEQQMLPKLRDACQKMGSSLRTVGWLESGLLTDDVLQRFPYKEHPDNVALVLALADELGCDRDLALKEMADRLVPDLGVLKTYPVATVRKRFLEFTNGMSANEQFGCLQNWKRMGFDQQDYVAEPQVWITTVVNNRADRVPRSRVFAEMMVHDLAADCHFLIGSNLKGLLGYIWSAFEQMLENHSLWKDGCEQGDCDALAAWQRTAHRFRQPTDGSQVRATLGAMLRGLTTAEGQGPDGLQMENVLALWKEPVAVERELTRLGAEDWYVKSLVRHLRSSLTALNEYSKLADQIRACENGRTIEIERALHATLRRWFERKLVVIADYEASGEEIVERICEETPPGFLNRIMGLQNIKGTGLDFVYRWQSWEKCYEACELLEQTKPALAEQGLEMLAEFQDFGLLCNGQLSSTFSAVKSSPLAQRERFQAELDSVFAKTQLAPQAAVNSVGRQTWLGGLRQSCLRLLEQFAEVSDAVRRRKTADKIYRDLAHERISVERAILELGALSKRQKGGWLSSRHRATSRALPVVPLTSSSQSSSPQEASSDPRSHPSPVQPIPTGVNTVGDQERR